VDYDVTSKTDTHPMLAAWAASWSLRIALTWSFLLILSGWLRRLGLIQLPNDGLLNALIYYGAIFGWTFNILLAWGSLEKIRAFGPAAHAHRNASAAIVLSTLNLAATWIIWSTLVLE
jgi:hypothetical protein